MALWQWLEKTKHFIKHGNPWAAHCGARLEAHGPLTAILGTNYLTNNRIVTAMKSVPYAGGSLGGYLTLGYSALMLFLNMEGIPF